MALFTQKFTLYEQNDTQQNDTKQNDTKQNDTK